MAFFLEVIYTKNERRRKRFKLKVQFTQMNFILVILKDEKNCT